MNEPKPEVVRMWFDVGVESLRSAQRLFDAEAYRSSVSRAYFALFQMSTALMLHLDYNPPERGNWGHNQLWSLVKSIRSHKVMGRGFRAQLPMLEACYHARAQADYAPHAVVDEHAARQAMRWAGFMRTKVMGFIKHAHP